MWIRKCLVSSDDENEDAEAEFPENGMKPCFGRAPADADEVTAMKARGGFGQRCAQEGAGADAEDGSNDGEGKGEGEAADQRADQRAPSRAAGAAGAFRSSAAREELDNFGGDGQGREHAEGDPSE